ncbi:SAM-dependent methyltransferase [Bacteroides sp.]|uniref:SAM-dependent methyltransferase n=1 Tax=Bacteroides sp. TaxID=29523 RepID=UPI002FCC7F2B
MNAEDIKFDPRNYRLHGDANKRLINKSLDECGAGRSILVDRDNVIIAGNGVFEQAKQLGLNVRVIESDGKELVVVKRTDIASTDEKRKLLAFADNQTSDKSEFDLALIEEDFERDILDDWELEIGDIELDEVDSVKGRTGVLKERFIIPPFSVLDAKSGNWQERKRAWLDLGIKSDDGRDGNITFNRSAQPPKVYEVKNKLRAKTGTEPSWDEVMDYCQKNNIPVMGGTSIFDPVLCELSYRWFNLNGGSVLDPFAGGSVRGIVASKLGMPYFGVDLRNEQIESNYKNALEVIGENTIPSYPTWVCGDSCHIDTLYSGMQVDFIFSCPPYADLEVYSDDPKDLSTMKYDDFKQAYFEIIKRSCSMLKDDRFAVFVVGEVRSKQGVYRNFVSDTISAFIEAGMVYYNEMILVNQIGSLAMRASNQFNHSRKIGKHHQNVLVFYKGDTNAIGSNYPELDLSECEI